MQDSKQIVQLWSIATQGGEPQQITYLATSIQSTFSISPDGFSAAFVVDNRITRCDINTGNCQQLTSSHTLSIASEAVVWSPDGNYIAYMREKNAWRQLFIVDARQ